MAESVLIIGYGRGLGQGLARAFAGAGHNLALIARSVDGAGPVIAQLRAGGSKVLALPADAGDFTRLQAQIEVAAREQGPIDVAIYNVVAPHYGKPSEVEPESLVQDFRANVGGALVMAQAVLPGMRERGRGTLLLTGGGWAHYPQALATSIAMGKAALRSLAFTLNEETQGQGLRVGMLSVMGPIAPGTRFDPDTLGQAFMARHQEPVDGFAAETFFKGSEQGA